MWIFLEISMFLFLKATLAYLNHTLTYISSWSKNRGSDSQMQPTVSRLLCSGVSGQTAFLIKTDWRLNCVIMFWNIRQHQCSASLKQSLTTWLYLPLWYDFLWIKHFFELKLPQTLDIAHASCLNRVSAEWSWCCQTVLGGVWLG